jgi:tRNA(Ile)-lysidine synthase
MKDPFLDAVARTIANHRLLSPRESILVAVSGGPDSVALLAALLELSPGGWRIGVGHVDHHLRGLESRRDRRFVERLAARLGCDVHVAEVRITRGANLEERAREARYDALFALARRNRYRTIATAHTLDDQAETVLHRLARGAGPRGLAGIARRRADGVVRPLLDVSRKDVLCYLRRRGLGHRVDRTNASARFTRNRIRRRVLPLLARELNPAIHAALGRAADLFRDDDAALETAARARLRHLGSPAGLDCGRLQRLAPALQRRVVRLWIAAERGSLRTINLEHVERVRAIAREGADGGSVSLPGGGVTRTRGRLRWGAAQPLSRRRFARKLPREGSVSVEGWRFEVRRGARGAVPARWRAVFDLAQLDGRRLEVRSPRAGDRIRPLGLGGTKKLQDVFVDAKLPRAERSAWPVLTAGGRIVWVPGLVRGEEAPVRELSERLLVVEAWRVAAPIPMC